MGASAESFETTAARAEKRVKPLFGWLVYRRLRRPRGARRTTFAGRAGDRARDAVGRGVEGQTPEADEALGTATRLERIRRGARKIG